MERISEFDINNDEIRLLSYNDICEITSLSRPTISRMIKRGEFPSPVALGGGKKKRRAFKYTDIKEWVGGLKKGDGGE